MKLRQIFEDFVLPILVIVLIVAVISSQCSARKYRAELATKTANIEALNNTVKTYKSKAGLNVAQMPAVFYNTTEVTKYDPKLVQTIKDMKLELKNVQAIIDVQTETIKKFRANVAITPEDTCYNFEDKWTTLSLCTSNDSVLLQVRDRLTTVINKVPKHKFLWWSWGIKGVNVNIVSENPNTSFEYLKFVEIK